MSRRLSAHQAALASLLTPEERADYRRRRQALLSRQRSLEVLEIARTQGNLTKKALADKAGLDPSSVRRVLTAEAANPTAENMFLLMGAAGVKVEAVLPSGKRVSIV